MFRASPESPAMFPNPFVDRFSRTPWQLVPAVYIPLIIVFLAYSRMRGTSAVFMAGEMVAGVFSWTLMEYWLHRTVFHWKGSGPWGEKFHFYVHGVHHEFFKDPYRLVMPPAASLSLGVAIFLALRILETLVAPVAPAGWVPGYFAGLMTGYLMYDLTHYALHHLRWQNRVFRSLAEHHAKHHHNPKYAERKFGVSSPLWDIVFRTN